MISAFLVAAGVMLLWASRAETIRQLADDDLPVGAIGLGAAAIAAAYIAGLLQ